MRIQDAYRMFKTDSLFRNAVFLMTSTAVMSVLGFGFWMFVAHLYTPSQIGLASALISVTLLISNLSMLGLNSGLIRFLPTSKNQSRDINTAILTVGAVTVLAAAVYMLFGNRIGNDIPFFESNPWGKALFLLVMLAVSLNSLTDSVFIANRRAGYHTLVYTTFGTIRLALPLVLIWLGSLGIFFAYAIAAFISLLLSLFFMWRACGYRLLSKPNWSLLRHTRSYATNNYLGVILSGLPSQLMPVLIIARLGSAQAAYFSMAWTMVNLLYVIPSSTTQSLLAENSQSAATRSQNVKRAVRLLAIFLIPAITLSILIAPYLLQLFGDKYADGSAAIFQILAVATIFVSGNLIGNTILNVKHQTNGIVAAQAVFALTSFVAAFLLIPFGLPGIGVAMLLGYMSANVVHLVIYLRNRRTEEDDSIVRFAANEETLRQLLKGYGIQSFSFTLFNRSASKNGAVLISANRRKYVLKMYPMSSKSADQVEEEAKFTSYLAKQKVPVTRFVKNSAGRMTSQKEIDGERWVYMLIRFEEGDHPTRFSRKLLQEMAVIHGQIHRVGEEYAATHTDPNELKSLFKMNWRLYRVLLRSRRGVSHFDFTGSNLLVKNGAIRCVLDFEGMRYDLLSVCVIYTLANLYSTEKSAGKLEIYLKSYQSVCKLSWGERLMIRFGLIFATRSPRMLFLSY